ncbi:MAG: hypothetical protein ACRDJN_04050 [Chloroflexota bacterium]
MSIRYTIAACPLGRLLVAATERGVCFAGLGDADVAVEVVLCGCGSGGAAPADCAAPERSAV